MKKIIFIFCFFFLLIPSLVLAFENGDISADKVFVKYADLEAQGKMDIKVNFKLKGLASELEEIKMMKLAVKDTCPNKGEFHVQRGDFRPEAQDFQDGVIEGTLIYEATKENSCKGEHDVKFYLCRTTNKSCTYDSNTTDQIDDLEKLGVVEIGDNPPDDQNPPDNINPPGDNNQPPADQGGGYDPLLPGKGKFLTIWDLLARIVQIMLALAGVVAVGAVVIGGYQYMSSSGIPDKAQIAKSTITYAIIGLILVMIMYAIMRFVLPLLGVSRDVIWF